MPECMETETGEKKKKSWKDKGGLIEYKGDYKNTKASEKPDAFE